jgi:hypothetical protein
MATREDPLYFQCGFAGLKLRDEPSTYPSKVSELLLVKTRRLSRVTD